MTKKPMHKSVARASRGDAASPRRLYHPGPPIVDEASLRRAAEALRAKDVELVDRLLSIGGPTPLRRREPGFAGLAAIIVSQQVSVASANAIFGRLEMRLSPLEAEQVAAATEEDLRSCGLSAPKIRALRALAEAVVAGGLDLAGLAALDAEEAHEKLVAVKGVGPWTADIFLLFCLGHPDAFPAGDLALQEAAKLALGRKVRPNAARLERIAERWRPWRGVAARMLWAYYRASRSVRGWRSRTVPANPIDHGDPGADAMSAALDGARIPASIAPANGLVVFLHGYGADGKDLIEIGRQWRGLLPGIAFVSPDASEPCAGAPMGRQWFALSNRPPDDPAGAQDRWNGVVKARAALDAFLDAELERLGLEDSRLALVGFSQGSMMALHVGLRRRRAPAAILGYSGLLVGAERLKEATARDPRGAPPPILLVHGDQDPLIPVGAMFMAAEALVEASIPAQWHISFGVGHGIDAGGLHHGGLFLAEALYGKGGDRSNRATERRERKATQQNK